MYEQDIELAKLLLARLTDLNDRTGSLHEELDATRSELARIASVRDERAQYMDILARAARLLERPDLEVESPHTDELEQREAELLGLIDEINREGQIYRELIGELSTRAPQLVQAASGPTAEAEEAAAETAAHALVEVADDLVVAEDDELVAAAAQTEHAPFEPGMSAEYDSALILSRFNINNLKAKENFTFGRGAAYLVDATSVLERVPYYDQQNRAMRENAARDELLRDIDALSAELTGEFHVVFSSWHQPATVIGNTVSVEYGTGDGEGTKAASDVALRELCDRLATGERSVCIVTGDTALADELRGPGVHIISLGEFYQT